MQMDSDYLNVADALIWSARVRWGMWMNQLQQMAVAGFGYLHPPFSLDLVFKKKIKREGIIFWGSD